MIYKLESTNRFKKDLKIAIKRGYDMECHISPDWLLVYRIYEDVLVRALSRTGSHSDLFKYEQNFKNGFAS
jgi:mRNA interferase YafQ